MTVTCARKKDGDRVLVESLYHRTGFNCVVKSLRFRVSNAFYNCVIECAYCLMHDCVLIFASFKTFMFAIIS